MTAGDGTATGQDANLCKRCGERPRLQGGNPFCDLCDLAVLLYFREVFPDAADSDFEREVPRDRPGFGGPS
jgi:hypothetical protein